MWLEHWTTFIWRNHLPSFTATSAVPMCCFGDKVINGGAKCHITERLTLCSRQWQLVLVPVYTVHLRHFQGLWRYSVYLTYLNCSYICFIVKLSLIWRKIIIRYEMNFCRRSTKHRLIADLNLLFYHLYYFFFFILSPDVGVGGSEYFGSVTFKFTWFYPWVL